ncbi:pectate lyase [Novosphingobium flavum]|uniref:Pectate lyase n=1 Tax=Novosphingobium flavum TaxID=1778672 RepID=A0A7X1FSU2_9SPHN|nr:pectate lyase [Novosphingobium flavum]MBC2666325.1 pectate lyase [Novosphingobium flavum]
MQVSSWRKAAITASFLTLAASTANAAAGPLDPTQGGAGGRIIRVTTLAKDGPGSLKEAVEAKGPRVVVFEVGGNIDLGRDVLTIAEPYLTIAGQTAPSPGITIIRGGIDLKGHDVILSHIRVMTGADGKPHFSDWEADAFSSVAAHHVLVEHCSFLWALDENMSASGPRFTGKTLAEWRANTSHDVVFRDNLAAEGLAFSSHPKGEHSKGSLIHDNATNITFYRNVFAHNVERSPLVKGGAQVLMVNNLIYDPGHRAVHYNLMNLEWTGHPYVTGEITAVGNVMRGGNSTDADLPFLTIGGDGDLKYYGQDNRAVDRFGKALPMFGRYGETKARILQQKAPLRSVTGIPVLPSGEVETSVLQTAGARPWDRAPDDIRVLFFVAEGRGEIIDDEHQVGNGYPKAAETRASFNPAAWNLDTMTPRSGRYPGDQTGPQEKLSPRDAAMRQGGV